MGRIARRSSTSTSHSKSHLGCAPGVTSRPCGAGVQPPLRNARLRSTRTLLRPAELTSHPQPHPRGYKSHANHTKSIFNQLLELYGVRRGGTRDRAWGGGSIHAAHSQGSRMHQRCPRSTSTTPAYCPALPAVKFCRKCVEMSRNKQPAARLGQSHMPALPPPLPGAPNQNSPSSQFPVPSSLTGEPPAKLRQFWGEARIQHSPMFLGSALGSLTRDDPTGMEVEEFWRSVLGEEVACRAPRQRKGAQGCQGALPSQGDHEPWGAWHASSKKREEQIRMFGVLQGAFLSPSRSAHFALWHKACLEGQGMESASPGLLRAPSSSSGRYLSPEVSHLQKERLPLLALFLPLLSDIAISIYL